MTVLRPGTHNARLLAVLADGRWHSTSALHRRAGNMIVHSRISELRKRGYRIDHQHVPGKVGAVAHRYRWLDAPGVTEPAEPKPLFDWDDLAPRRPAERYRVYRKRAGTDLELVATCGSPEAVGVTLCTLANEGEWDRANVGVLDIEGGKGNGTGHWLVSPFETGTY